MDRDRRLRQRGISLTEILVVMVVAAILFASTMPSWDDRQIIGANARTLVSDAVRARSYAQRIWDTVTMDVEVENDRWRLVVQDSGAWVDGPGADDQGWRHLDKYTHFQAVPGVSEDFVFLPNGRCAANGEVWIVSGDLVWAIRVNPLSGTIEAEPVNQP